jgi:hypothetical protein
MDRTPEGDAAPSGTAAAAAAAAVADAIAATLEGVCVVVDFRAALKLLMRTSTLSSVSNSSDSLRSNTRDARH